MPSKSKKIKLQREEESLAFVEEGPNEFLQGQKFGLQIIQPALVDVKSEFQQIQIFNTPHHGRVLILDGVVQLSEGDEFAYHEMIAHVPLSCTDKKNKRVLLIGAGDGGALREICRHSKTYVKSVVQVEIDEQVIKSCQRFLPKVSNGAFDDSRLTLHVTDGLEFVRKEKPNAYHTIIVDSSDPSQGPNGPLFDIEFYRNLHRIMNKKSVLCIQGENPWYHENFLKAIREKLVSIFGRDHVTYYGTYVPTYPGGYIGFFLCWKGEFDPRICAAKHVEEQILPGCKYYTRAIHSASFVLPKFIDEFMNISV